MSVDKAKDTASEKAIPENKVVEAKPDSTSKIENKPDSPPMAESKSDAPRKEGMGGVRRQYLRLTRTTGRTFLRRRKSDSA